MNATASCEVQHKVSQGFFSVEGRQVHYRQVGHGPPALFIHSSPTNGSFVLPDMLAQADRYTCFAFDTPGFGLSDPLPLAEMKVAHLADATAAAMLAIGLPPVPVFGTHSGAAIGLELGYRHPERVTGLVLDGVPVFTREEVSPLRGRYFAPLDTDALGGHYSATWTRFRDQSRWFPWYSHTPEAINEYDLATPEATHRWTQMFFAAAAHYKPAYLAVTAYCEEAIEAAAGLRVPAIFTATETDMLYSHLKRLPPLREGQRIVEIGIDHARKRALTGEGFAEFGSRGGAPLLTPDLEAGAAVFRQFRMDGDRPQMLRYAGDRAHPVLLLLHDLPGSSLMVEPLIKDLSSRYFVIAPDLPGSGESEALGEAAELADYATALWRMCDALNVDAVDLQAIGFGSSLGVEMAAQAPTRCRTLTIDGLLLPSEEQRAELLANYAPQVRIGADGGHWFRLWQMLRDSKVYWPWYDTRRVALRRVAEDFSGEALHAWTVEVMKQGASYHRLLEAILRHNAGARLCAVTANINYRFESSSCLAKAYGDKLAQKLTSHPTAVPT